jgi:AAA ATPase domain
MRADRGASSGLRTLPAELAEICRGLTSFVASGRGSALVADLSATVGGTATEILWQALLADCLRVIYSAMLADGEIEDREIDAVNEILTTAASHYATRPRSQYAELARVDRESSRAFLDCYAADRGPFGRGARLRWPGLMLCRRAAELGEQAALRRYTKTMTSLIVEASLLGGLSEADPRGLEQADELNELRRLLASETTAMTRGVDRRVQAFLAPCRVFSAVQQASSIFENDPFDVEAVHREARVSFEQLVAQATMRPHVPDLGRMLVVLGDSGAGKTHLLRGFRRHVQEGNRGFVVYAQLQSRTADYSRYLLFHLVDSLSRRYSEQSGRTGLHELASGLVRLARPALRTRLERLVNDTWDAPGNLADYVNELVDEVLGIRELQTFDRDLLRVLVYALRPDPRTTASVYKYLHCDDMNAHDRHWIGDVSPRTRDDDAQNMIRALASFAAVTDRALVVMVDQVDLAGFEADSTRIFRRAIDALYRIVSEIPSAVAVVACLSDLYNAARSELNRPAIDRLENSPPIARLQINRSYVEIEAVVARRLTWLFAEHGTVHRLEQPVYPIPESELRQLENRRLRDVLEWCHQFQAQCAAAGKIINADEPVIVEPKGRELDLDTIAAAWSEAVQAKDLELPSEEDQILAVVAEAARAYVHETGLSLTAPPHKNGVLRLQMLRGEDCAALAIAVVNRGYHRGAFPSDIESLRRRARGMVPIAVRTLEFPHGRACDKAVDQLVNMGGRTAYLDASTLRALVAFQRFEPAFAPERIAAWKLRDRPISSLPAVVEIFDFDRSRVERPVAGASGRGKRASPVAVETEASDAVLDAAAGSSPVAAADGRDSGRGVAVAAAPTMTAAPPARTPAAGSPVTPLVATAAQPRSVGRGDDSPAPAPPGEGKPVEPARRPRTRAASVPALSAATSIASSVAPNGTRAGSAPAPSAAGPPAPSGSKPATPAGPLRLGTSTSFEAEPIFLEPASLLRHVAVVDGVGSGRIASALHLVEQTLERGVPAILLDRTGEMAGYARPDWWLRSASPMRARQLAEQTDVRLFTPGIRGGRPLSVAVVPDLSRIPRADHEREIQVVAAAVAATLRASTTGDDAGRLALLTQAVAVLARRSSAGAAPALPELIELIETGGDELTPAAAGDPLRQGLIEELAALLGNADVFIHGAEALTAATLLGPGPGGRVPLAIIQTGFLGDGSRLRAWVAQLLGVVSRELAAAPSRTLKAMFVLDGADLLLPASARTASAREPLQELLARAGAAGLGLVLASQRPGELDYRRCAPIQTWLVGKTDEPTLGRMTSLFDQRPLGHRNPSRLEPGRFVLLHDGGARDVERASPLIRIERPGEPELKNLAARTHPRTRETPSVRRAEPATDALPPLHVPSR